MKNILRFCVLLIAIGFSQIANAQLYNDEACFYIWEASSNPQRCYIVKFDGDKIFIAMAKPDAVRKMLAEDPAYFDNINRDTQFPKASGFVMFGSTWIKECRIDNYIESSKTMYSDSWLHQPQTQSAYYAFTEDLSYYLQFTRSGDKLKKNPLDNNKFVRVSKEYFSLQGVNDDVLKLLEE